MTLSEKQKNTVGIYVRLSIEDNGCGTQNSIKNQVIFLQEFVKNHEKEFDLVETYVDNGITGTHFHRQAWRKMIEDIKSGKINCIVVKDFSRIGRNYIEVGNYLENIFPFLGIRVIAVNENFDSEKEQFEDRMMINSLTNIVNEYYARDISRKVTQAKKTMQNIGEYVSGICPYGYKKSQTEKKLIVDPGSAFVVKKIFELRVEGRGCIWIANYLNDLAIPSPGLYRYMNGNRSFERSHNIKWKSRHVSGILKDLSYLGYMVQGKTRRSYFENDGKLRYLPKEKWKIIENAHEPLVTQEQFHIAAKMAEQSRKKHIMEKILLI